MTDVIDDESPELLYKFVRPDSPDIDQVLLRSEMWFGSPSGFNDPFDCLPVLDMRSTVAQREKAVRSFAKRHYAHLSRTERRKEVRPERNRMRRPISSEAGLQAWRAIIDQMGVTCFSEVASNLLMWGHYAAKHSGLCFGFRAERLPGVLLKVAYTEDRPIYRWADQENQVRRENAHRALCTKATSWDYEREWRSFERANGIQPMDHRALSVVILGARCSNRLEDQVRNALAKMTDVAIERARLHDLRYEVEALPC